MPDTDTLRGGRGETEVLPEPAVDLLFQQGLAQHMAWTTMTLRLPSKTGAPATLTLMNASGYPPHARSQLTLEPVTGRILKWEPASAQSRGWVWRSGARYLHTGEAGGPAGQAVAALGALGGVFLVYTGFSLAWHRFRSWNDLRLKSTAAHGYNPKRKRGSS